MFVSLNTKNTGMKWMGKKGLPFKKVVWRLDFITEPNRHNLIKQHMNKQYPNQNINNPMKYFLSNLFTPLTMKEMFLKSPPFGKLDHTKLSKT